jgi:hypothetical protein
MTSQIRQSSGLAAPQTNDPTLSPEELGGDAPGQSESGEDRSVALRTAPGGRLARWRSVLLPQPFM